MRARSVIRGPKRLLLELAARGPRASFAIARALDAAAGALLDNLDRGEPIAELPVPDPSLAARAPWERSARFRLFGTLLWHGYPVPDLEFFDLPDLSDLQPPAILASLHTGPLLSVGLILERLPSRPLALSTEFPSGARFESLHVAPSLGSRARAVRRAVEELRTGRFVFTTIDNPQRRRHVEAAFLGRNVKLAPGAFVLSRLARAPIVPLLATWQDGRVVVLRGPLVAPGPDETMGSALGRWLDQLFRTTPLPLGPNFVRTLLRMAPLVDATS